MKRPWYILLAALPLWGDLLDDAKDHEEKKCYQEAKDLYIEVLHTDPDNFEALLGAGRMASWLGEWSVAEKLLEKAIREDPKNQTALIALGYLYFWRADYPQAKKYINRALRINPRNVEGLIARSRLYLADGDYGEAQSYLREAKRRNAVLLKRKKIGHQALISAQEKEVEKYFLFADAEEALAARDISKAIDRYSALLKLEPNNVDVLCSLGRLYAWKGELYKSESFLTRASLIAPNNPEVVLAWANWNYFKNRYAKAAHLVEGLLQESPNNVDYLVTAAKIYQAKGDLNRSLHYYETAKSIDKAHPELAMTAPSQERLEEEIKEKELRIREEKVLRQGDELEIEGEYEQALKLYLSAEERDPDHPIYLYRIGIVYSQLQDWGKAINYFKAALYHNPELNRARLYLAEAYFWSKEYARAEKQIRIVLKKEPNLSEALMIAGDIARLRRQYKEAIHYYDRVLALDPMREDAQEYIADITLKLMITKELEENVLDQHETPLEKEADHLADEEKYEKALVIYEELLKEFPEQPTYLIKAAEVCIELKRFELAQTYLQEALIIDPYDHDARFLLASLYFRLGNYRLARRQVGIILEENPRNGNALVLLGRIEMAQNNFEMAEQHLNEALEYKESKFDANDALAQIDLLRHEERHISPRLRQGLYYEQNWEYEKALDIYWALYQEYPDDQYITYRVGRVYAQMQRWPEAEYYLNLCLSRDYYYDDARVGLSYVYYWKKDYDMAIKEANIVLGHNPNYIDALLAAGRAYRLGLDIPKAEEYFKRALALDPDHYDTLLALAQLEEAKRNYDEAYKGFKYSHDTHRFDPLAWRGAIVMRPMVKPSIDVGGGYSNEREDDLLTKILTTQINTISGKMRVTYPIYNRFIPYAEGNYEQNEQLNKILDNTNFLVNSYTGLIGARVNFADYWDFRIQQGLRASRNGASRNFPFINRTQWEPMVAVRYSVPQHNFAVSGYKDGLIGRHFQTSQSYLVPRKYVTAFYEWRFTPPYNAIGAEASYGWLGGFFTNEQRDASLWVRGQIPACGPKILAKLAWDYRGFQKVTGDYNAFKLRNEIWTKWAYVYEWIPTLRLELATTVKWSKTVQLTNQSEIIVTSSDVPQDIPKNIFRAVQFDIQLQKVFSTFFHVDANFFYYLNSNNYRTLAGKASLKWVF